MVIQWRRLCKCTCLSSHENELYYIGLCFQTDTLGYVGAIVPVLINVHARLPLIHAVLACTACNMHASYHVRTRLALQLCTVKIRLHHWRWLIEDHLTDFVFTKLASPWLSVGRD